MTRTIELDELTDGTNDHSRAWERTLADDTTISVMYQVACEDQGEGENSWWISAMWEVEITHPDGETVSSDHYDYDAGRTADNEDDADQEAADVASSADLDDLPADLWTLTIGRMLATMGVALDNERALGMLGEDVLAGRRVPSEHEVAAAIRMHRN